MKSIRAKPGFCRTAHLAPGLGGASAVLLGATPAGAHAFGARYDLPLPLDFWMLGAGAAVALSFVIMALAFRARPSGAGGPGTDLLRFKAGRILAHGATIGLLRAVSVGLFLLVIATGYFSVQDTVRNFAPTFVWIIWWVGFVFLACLAGNLWPVVNPWSILFAWAVRLLSLFANGFQPKPMFVWPTRLGVWPAAALFGLFAWFELISEAAVIPHNLATLILIYSGLTWAGMVAFGLDVWIARGDPFSIAFSVLGRFAPLIGRHEDQADGWRLRPYGAGLITDRPCSPSMTVFVLLMLSTVTFDGFKETPFWFSLVDYIVSQSFVRPVILGIHGLGLDIFAVLKTVTLALFPLLFVLVYRGFSWLAKDVSRTARPVPEIAGLFVFSLVPIAIAYHLAHYLSYLLVSGQLFIPLASDPFGVGWNLFGTADYTPSIGIVGARFVWYFAVIAIVVGHVFAVGVAHFTALRVFESARMALRSQYPFLFLMVAYTMVSLWILSQPIIEMPGLKSTSRPSATLTLAPFEFHEYCLDLAAGEAIRYEFEADAPIAFNIHYHAGLTVRYPVRVSAVTRLADAFNATALQPYCLMWTNEGATDATLTYRTGRP